LNKKKQYNIAIYDEEIIRLCNRLRGRGCLGRTIERLLYDNYDDIIRKENIIKKNKVK